MGVFLSQRAVFVKFAARLLTPRLPRFRGPSGSMALDCCRYNYRIHHGRGFVKAEIRK